MIAPGRIPGTGGYESGQSCEPHSTGYNGPIMTLSGFDNGTYYLARTRLLPIGELQRYGKDTQR